LNECTKEHYRAHLLSSEQNHYAHALAYSFRELGDEVYLVGITVILPEMRLLFQQYFGIMDCVCSL